RQRVDSADQLIWPRHLAICPLLCQSRSLEAMTTGAGWESKCGLRQMIGRKSFSKRTLLEQIDMPITDHDQPEDPRLTTVISQRRNSCWRYRVPLTQALWTALLPHPQSAPDRI